jgi:hypothetical protein
MASWQGCRFSLFDPLFFALAGLQIRQSAGPDICRKRFSQVGKNNSGALIAVEVHDSSLIRLRFVNLLIYDQSLDQSSPASLTSTSIFP